MFFFLNLLCTDLSPRLKPSKLPETSKLTASPPNSLTTSLTPLQKPSSPTRAIPLDQIMAAHEARRRDINANKLIASEVFSIASMAAELGTTTIATLIQDTALSLALTLSQYTNINIFLRISDSPIGPINIKKYQQEMKNLLEKLFLIVEMGSELDPASVSAVINGCCLCLFLLHSKATEPKKLS